MRISGITYAHRKTHRARNYTLIAIIFLILVSAATVIVSMLAAWRITHPSKVPQLTVTSNIVPEHKELSFADINRKYTLNGWYFEVKGSSKTVILAHGYGKNKLQFGNKTLDIIKDLYNKGYSILAFDFRGAAPSGKSPTTFGINEKDDLLGAVGYVKAVGAKQIVVMGFYTGASTAIMSAADGKYSDSINAIIADTPYSDLDEHLNRRLSTLSGLPPFPFNNTILMSLKLNFGITTSKASPISDIYKLSPRPLLLIHSEDDETVQIESTRALYNEYKASAGNVFIWETKSAKEADSYLVNPEGYMKRVFNFLDTSLKKR